jgi:hypothetical protein
LPCIQLFCSSGDPTPRQIEGFFIRVERAGLWQGVRQLSLKESCDATITLENNNAQLLVGATGWCENASVNRPTDRTLNRFGGAGHWSSKQQQFRPFEEVATFKIIKNTKEAIALSLSGAASVKGEVALSFLRGRWQLALVKPF